MAIEEKVSPICTTCTRSVPIADAAPAAGSAAGTGAGGVTGAGAGTWTTGGTDVAAGLAPPVDAVASEGRTAVGGVGPGTVMSTASEAAFLAVLLSGFTAAAAGVPDLPPPAATAVLVISTGCSLSSLFQSSDLLCCDLFES